MYVKKYKANKDILTKIKLFPFPHPLLKSKSCFYLMYIIYSEGDDHGKKRKAKMKKKIYT